MTISSYRVRKLLRQKMGRSKNRHDQITHYIALLEKKDEVSRMELENLEISLMELRNSFNNIEERFHKFKKSQNIRTEVTMHLSTHNYLL